ncbi:MAG: glycoside hydrolase, partial [Flavobacterium sp.]
MLQHFKHKIIALSIVIACINSGCKSGAVQSQKAKSVILKEKNFKHYVDYFNTMEDENLKFAIPNDSAWAWMEKNIPLFECPQQNFEEIYYFRWWSVRKHIKNTPQGFAITEFLVDRSYADK